jgi:hypothetical protein
MISPSRALLSAQRLLKAFRRRRQRFAQAGALESQGDDLPLEFVGAAQRHELHGHLA